MFEPYLYTAEGFRITKRKYVVPEGTISLPAVERRAIAICNLLANEHKSIDEIAALLDTSRSAVISALIQQGLILDRRGLNRHQKIEKRQAAKYHLPLVLTTGQTDEYRALCGGQFGSETVSEFVFNEVLKKEERCEECLKRSMDGK
jgi:hypothetical protein